MIEWWYFNGNLWTEDGRHFSYMNTLFAAKPKQVKIPFLEKIPLKIVYFSHYLLTDNKAHKFQSKTNPICLVNPHSFTKPLLWVQYDNACLIEETNLFDYHIVNDFVDLNLCATKKPLLLNKQGFIDLQTKTTYYYSLTSLETEGLVNIKGKWTPVKGLSWFDHQWAQGPLIRGDKWTWFSIQLDNGWDLVCFEYGDDVKILHASLMDAQGKSKFTDDVIIRPTTQVFKSQETGSEFQLGWQIKLPSWDIDLEIKPFNKKQEMIFGTINYWEGGIDIIGKIGKKKVKGLGFMELVGSPMRKSALKVYLNKFKKEIFNNPIKRASAGLGRKLRAYR